MRITSGRPIKGITPFKLAAAIGNLTACNMMYDPNGKVHKFEKALHFAAYNGHLDICQFLLERIKIKNPKIGFFGSTPLHEAASHGHLEICQFIMKYIETNPSEMKNFLGKTPLDLAEENGHSTVVEYLSCLSKNRKCHQWIEKPKKQKKI